MNCPVCQLPLPQPAPFFCPQCAWNLKNDPTLNTFLSLIPEKDFFVHQQGVELARKNWEYLQNAKKEKVHRFVNDNTGQHFYTIDEAEKYSVLQNYTWFRYEGIGFCAYPTEQPETLPVYRFFNKDVGCHFYTLDEAEKGTDLQDDTCFRYEGIAFYVFSTEQPETLPVYRFFNKDIHGHFYTLDEAEKDTVMQDCTWIYESVAFYAYPSP
jgi:hypothetical protein